MKEGLSRFRQPHQADYPRALSEIRNGRKTGHWIWYIFPQMKGLGTSGMSDYYGISDIEEAKAYLADPVLGPRLVEISEALMELKEKDAAKIFGFPDVLKVRSCMTLFDAASGEESVFRSVLDAYYGGEKDERTLRLLDEAKVR